MNLCWRTASFITTHPASCGLSYPVGDQDYWQIPVARGTSGPEERGQTHASFPGPPLLSLFTLTGQGRHWSHLKSSNFRDSELQRYFCDEDHEEKWFREVFCFFFFFSSYSLQEEKSGQELRAGTEAETLAKCCLLACSLACSVCFLIQLRRTCSGLNSPAGHPRSITNQENVFLVEVNSSQMTLCVKWITKPNPHISLSWLHSKFL